MRKPRLISCVGRGAPARATANPEAGDLIRETGECRKVRRSRAGAEKSSGVRVIYFNRLSNPLLAHFRLPIASEHFARWLTLFAEARERGDDRTPCSASCA